ncbi:acyloxyacyl hydrolase [Limibacter armeniacum]|uniref:acyloxyacyl hydrolase n=1 Tax=Limibacter armeniacum TaxID=466084 RepID=UPI002FE5B10A
MKLICFFLLIFLQSSTLLAQLDSASYTYDFGASLHGDTMLSIDNTKHLSYHKPLGFEVTYLRQTDGRKYWEEVQNYPLWGISLQYFDYRSNILKKMLSLSLDYRRNIYRGKRGATFIPLGIGLAYTPGYFDIEKNPLNTAIGQPVSFILYIGILQQIHINNYWSIDLKLGLTHYSNGGLSAPNSGVNLLNTSLGVSRKIQQPDFKKNLLPPALDNKLHCLLQVATGAKEVLPTLGRWPFYNATLLFAKNLNYRHAINIGVDYQYSEALKKEVHFMQTQWFYNSTNDNVPDHQTVSLLGGYEFKAGKISVPILLAAHIYKELDTLPTFYQKIGLRYWFNNLFASITLRSFTGNSDGIEWGLGFKI